MSRVQEGDENAVTQVLKGLQGCFRLIVEFQDGVDLNVRNRLQEKYVPLLITLPRQEYQWWPKHGRSLRCLSDDHKIQMSDLHVYCGVRDRRFALHLAIAEGEHDIVQKIWRFDQSLVTEDAFKCAVRFNQVDMVEWFFPFMKKASPHNYNPIRKIVQSCGQTIRRRTLEKLHQLGCPVDSTSFIRPLEIGHYCHCEGDSAIEYIFELLGANLGEKALVVLLGTAIDSKFGSLVKKILDLLATQVGRRENIIHYLEQTNCFGKFGASGQLEWVKRVLHLTNGEEKELIFEKAALRNHIHVLKWLKEQYNQEMPLYLWHLVIQESSLETIQWLATNYVSSMAQQWLKTRLVVSDPQIVKLVHLSGQYFNHICPSTAEAAQYLVEQNVHFGRIHILEWFSHYSNTVKSVDCNVQKCNTDLYNLIKFCVETFTRLKITEEILNAAAVQAPLQVLRYLYEYSTDNCTQETLDEVMKGRDLGKIKFLCEEKGMMWTCEGVQGALESNSYDVVKYVVANDKETMIAQIQEEGVTRLNLEILQLFAAELPSCADLWFPRLVECGDFETVRQVDLDAIRYSELGIAPIVNSIFIAIEHGELHILDYLWKKLKAVAHDDEEKMYANQFTAEIEVMKTNFPFSGPWNKFLPLS